MTEQDRIRLAEAVKISPSCFDPETNANDDYAVLEWMRENLPPVESHGYLIDQWAIGLEGPMYEYEIGDFARAALGVL